MKVVAFNGSPRTDGNTSRMIDVVLEVLKGEVIQTERVQLGGNLVRGCTACYKCAEKQDGHCVIDNDMINDCIDRMRKADGILLGSPTYFADVTAEIKALIDRAGFVSKTNGNFLNRKVGAAVVAVRRAGSIHAFHSMNNLFLGCGMIVPGSCYWNMAIGRDKGEVEGDEEGMKTMRVLGENMAWVLKGLA